MNEPYYEDQKPTDGSPYHPFHCHLQAYDQSPLMSAAHWHYSIEILYATRGSATVLLNGQSYTFRKGDMILIGARDVHAIFGEPLTQYICIKFAPEILYTAARSIFESRYVQPFIMARESPQKVFPEEEIGSTPLPELIVEALQEFLSMEYGFELAIRTNISRIFLWVLRSWRAKGLNEKAGYSLKERDMERLQQVFDCLDSRYMQNLTAQDMAQKCNMSYSYFSRYFKAAIGKSFTAYLNYVRITEAEKLLLSTDKSVTDIAMETGFSSASYFISQFRQLKDVSPRQFRQKLERAQ